jgi:hypothetical protein
LVFGEEEDMQMSAVLRAYGTDFDVDEFLTACTLPVCALKRRGEPVCPSSQPNGRRHECSGLHMLVSDAGFKEFAQQTVDATVFLQANSEQIRRLCAFPGVEDVTLDFGIARREAALQCDYLPPELVRIAGSLGLGIELSQYPPEPVASKAEPSASSDRPRD